jgi:hypothetical protein
VPRTPASGSWTWRRRPFAARPLAGVIIGALLALGVFILVTLVRTRGRQVKALQAEAKQRALDKNADAAATTQAARDAERGPERLGDPARLGGRHGVSGPD